MMLFTLAEALPTLLAIAFVAICVLMMLVILIQKPKGGGLGSAFGGGGGGGSESAAFGAKTGDVLTWITVACFVLFLLLAMGLTWTIRADVEPASSISNVRSGEPTPQQTTEQQASPDADQAEPDLNEEAVAPRNTPAQPGVEQTVPAPGADEQPAEGGDDAAPTTGTPPADE